MSVPAERRRYERHTIKLPGRLKTDAGQQSACVVRDYCSGGLLVQQLPAEGGEPPIRWTSGQTAQLKTDLLTPKGPRRVRIDAVVAWATDDFLGLSFARTSDAIVKALGHHDRLARSDTAVGLGATPGGEARYVAKLRQVANRVLPGVLREILVKTGEALLDKTDRLGSNAERQQVMGDINALEVTRQQDLLLTKLLTVALDGKVESASPADPVPGELSLVDPDDFERWLEASRVATLLDRRFTAQLNGIGSRLAAERRAATSRSLTVPFEPQQFTGVLKDLAKDLDLGAISRGVFFDQAARILKDKLGGFYQELDAALDAVGAPVAQASGNVAVLHSSGRAPQAAATDAEVARAAALGRPEEGAHARAQTDITGGFAAAGGSIDQRLLQTLLAREVKERTSHAQELMSYIADTPDVGKGLAGWLEQLGEPLVREAAADQTFFHDKQNPMREILDALGHLQMFLPGAGAVPADDPIGRRISQLLQPIGRAGTDRAALREIADSVSELTGEQSRQYQHNVERVVQACEGQDRVRRARQAVVADVNRRYAGRQVPELIPELIDVGWRTVLELAWLRSVDGGESYAEQLGRLDSLVARLGGEPFEYQSGEMNTAELGDVIADELAIVAFDPFRRNQFEGRLREALRGSTSGKTRLVEMPSLIDQRADAESQSRPDGISEQVWNVLLERCMNIVVGDRLRLPQDPEVQQELRVAWIRNDHERFVTVDHRGLRARELGLAELATGLHERRINVDPSDGRPLSVRAVDSILSRMEEQLAHQAAHDSLTGLINRRQFQVALEQALAMPDRSADTGVLFWLDIDQFRLVNDVHGYATGDRLLVEVARLLEKVKGAKVLGHLGGDRFAALLPDVALADGERRARVICQEVHSMPFDWEGQAIGLSASIGIVNLSVAEEGFSAVLQAADSALSAAKAAGGNQVYVYREDDPNIARRKESVHWVVQVDDALENGRLKLRCQPIVPVRPDQGIAPHYEVLLGVHSGGDKPLPIAEFIDAAERYNRMRSVDRWVTRTVMDWIAAQRSRMSTLHGFAVNLSGQTASDPSFLDFVREQFRRTGIDPAWLSFEVTETAAVSDLSSTAGIIHDLKALGCKVALDDFGSGLSSYSYLKELPVDWLKIDGVFVRKIAASGEDYAVVKSINEIGHFLGKKTIGEYVADEHILRCISEIGVDFAQGYGIAPPMLLDDLLADAELT